MKKKALLQTVKLCLILGMCCIPFHTKAADISDSEECAQEILLAYFPGIFVRETLSKFKVSQDQWDSINKELVQRDKEIIKKVEAKAAKMSSNPLKDPQQRQAAVKIFRETLFENFAEVMRAHGVKDDQQIQQMLDDIQQQKAKRFARCMQQQQPQSKPPAPAQDTKKTDEVSDEDDEDEG